MAKKSKKSREPFEYDPPFESEELPEKSRPKYKVVMAYLLDPDEVNRLIEASNSEYVEPPRSVPDVEYATYSEEECAALLDGKPYQRKLKKKK